MFSILRHVIKLRNLYLHGVKVILSIFFGVLLSLQANGQREEKNRELFFVSTGVSYSYTDNAVGFNERVGFPMQKGFYFITQATIFPDVFNFGFKEYRYEFDVELTFFSIKKMSFYGTTGLNFGYWKRTKSNLYIPTFQEFLPDNSLVFGVGMAYNVKGNQFFIDHKYYPEIKQTHISVGIKFKFFETKGLRESYFKYLQRKSTKSKAN